MSSVNKVILIGRLGADPEMKFTPSGSAVCNFRMATSESWKDKEGQKKEKTEWHRIVTWNKLAELCAEYLAKGRQAYVEGKLSTRKWQDREGADRYTTEVIAREVTFLGGREDRRDSRPTAEPERDVWADAEGQAQEDRNTQQGLPYREPGSEG